MSTDMALIEKREELKRRLAAGEYKTLADVFLEWLDRLIRKITRRSEPLPLWYITIVLILVVVLLGLISIYVTGDVASARKILELNPDQMGFGFSFLYLVSVLIGYLSLPCSF